MTPSESLIAWLGAASGDIDLLGGKGASLDRLVRLGFRVPPGFCVTTAAFRADPDPSAQGTHTPQLDTALRDAVSKLVADSSDVAADSGTAVPGANPRFAVRSSAVGEDGSAASYAGLHDTELDVPPEAIGSAVRRCWASLWSPAALAYRERRGIPVDEAAMAVVVQLLVPADAAAVAFTRHPVTGREDQIVITTVRGLGDAMVSGTVTPDTYVIDRGSRSVAAFEPGEDPHGPAVDEAGLAELIDLCLGVEAGFGQAVDIEAAMAGGTWYLLQARPITTGAPVRA